MAGEELSTIANGLDKTELIEIAQKVSKESFETGRKLGGVISDWIDELFDSINTKNEKL